MYSKVYYPVSKGADQSTGKKLPAAQLTVNI